MLANCRFFSHTKNYFDVKIIECTNYEGCELPMGDYGRQIFDFCLTGWQAIKSDFHDFLWLIWDKHIDNVYGGLSFQLMNWFACNCDMVTVVSLGFIWKYSSWWSITCGWVRFNSTALKTLLLSDIIESRSLVEVAQNHDFLQQQGIIHIIHEWSRKSIEKKMQKFKF